MATLCDSFSNHLAEFPNWHSYIQLGHKSVLMRVFFGVLSCELHNFAGHCCICFMKLPGAHHVSDAKSQGGKLVVSHSIGSQDAHETKLKSTRGILEYQMYTF